MRKSHKSNPKLKIFTWNAFILLKEKMMESSKTVTLIGACAAGDEHAIERFIHQYQLGVFHLAVSILRDEQDANDATQDVFIAALRAMERYKDYSTIKAWIYTITLNACRSRLRKRKNIESLNQTMAGLSQMERQHTPEDSLIKSQKDQALWHALEKLGEKHRLPVLLYYYHDLPVSEIAEILGTNEGTIHSRLFTARTRLRAEMEEHLKTTGE